MPDMRSIWLIADDFGQAEAIDRGILTLALQGRISGTSVLVESPRLVECAGLLREHKELARGLHFNLTHVFDKARPGLRQVLLAAYTGRLVADDLVRAWHQQLDRFEKVLQQVPDYIDGHQHVHQLPQVREAMLQVMTQRYGQLLPFRSTLTKQARGFKAFVIASLGARRLPQQHCMNSDFAGVYGFQGKEFAKKMATWLSDIADRGLIMCHPGETDEADPLRASRPMELKYLGSEAFNEACERQKIRLLSRQDLPVTGFKE
ncbi:MAG: ChbG/HpnK family deacetylase [Pseudomonadales bacterium]|nr:ChbG/HpnK family deacetylase [Pseudomonadales bacterium]